MATEPVDITITCQGSRVVGQDILPDGQKSVIKQTLMDCISPEHAAIIGEILSNPGYLVYLGSSKLTQKEIDQMACEMRKRRAGDNSTLPSGPTPSA